MAEEEKPVKVGVVDEIMNKALGGDGLQFWEELTKQIGKADGGTVEEFRQTVQSNDDEQRKNQGLEPRPWTEIEKELEAESDSFLNNFDEEVMKWDAEWQKAKGLDPRSAEEIENEEFPDTEKCVKLMKAAVMGYDGMKRREKGLMPRSEEDYETVWEGLVPVWEALNAAFKEEAEEAEEDKPENKGQRKETSPPNMASLSLGNASGLR